MLVPLYRIRAAVRQLRQDAVVASFDTGATLSVGVFPLRSEAFGFSIVSLPVNLGGSESVIACENRTGRT
jgi:hypothetical protein